MTEHYELLFIIPGSINEGDVASSKEKVLSLLNKQGAKITREEEWERRKLGYKIKQETYGYYKLYEFDAEKSIIMELNKQLRLLPEVLRFILVKCIVKTAEDLAEEEKIKEKIRLRQAESVKKELKEVGKKEEEEKKIEIKKEEEKTEGKLSMEDLDKKLDEILGDDLKV
ncbi:MAG: 30S ribosomal protein S6 [Patescibacteria group bacterium]|jgi:small subunit ribosomal protein S6